MEDFTTYTEVDPNARYAVAAQAITVTLVQRNEDAWIYADKGAGHFGMDFSHTLKIRRVTGGTWGHCSLWGVSDVIEDYLYWYTNHSDAANLHLYHLTDLWLREHSARDNDLGAVVADTDYWITVTRSGVDGVTLQAFIYDDAERTSLVDTLSVAMPASQTYRYVFTANTWNSGAPNATSCTIADLDLHEFSFSPANALIPMHAALAL